MTVVSMLLQMYIDTIGVYRQFSLANIRNIKKFKYTKYS